MRVAVVGGGLFGCLAAVEASKHADVTLYERHGNLLLGATRANQGRIHRGYHYPRDPHAGELGAHADRLSARFPGAVIATNVHRYLIAEDSKVDAEQYRAFCVDSGLRWMPSNSPLTRNVTTQVRAPEYLLDVGKVRHQLRAELSGVNVKLGTEAHPASLVGEYEHVIDATYGRYWPDRLQYEVCETTLIQLGPRFAGQSFVVMDGDYISLDPHGRLHMLYHVRHSVHDTLADPEHVPGHLRALLDRGLARTPHTRVEAMLATARKFLSGIGLPDYRGSLFTIRAVLPDDGTDARPTLIRHDGPITRVLAGKLCTAPWAAEQAALRMQETH